MINNYSGRTAIALGVFDGLHLGHRAVIDEAVKHRSMGLRPLVTQFDVHPEQIIDSVSPKKLMTDENFREMVMSWGAQTAEIDFCEVMNMSPADFIYKILFLEYNAAFVSCGYNFTFGIDRSGTTQTLTELCRKYGIECAVVPEVDINGIPISSTAIRNALEDGYPQAANKMLGHEFYYDFVVVDGDKRGRLLGAPTINQYFPDDFIIPMQGVYASQTFVDGEMHASVTDIGTRPSVNGSSIRSETCILGYHGNLYGQKVKVYPLKFIRTEIKFDDLDKLSARIARDAQIAAAYFDSYKKRRHKS